MHATVVIKTTKVWTCDKTAAIYLVQPYPWWRQWQGSWGGTQLFFRYGCAARISEVWGLWTDTCLWRGGGGGLWTENFQIWGLVSLAKIWAKTEAVEAKISKFSQKGGLVNWLFCLTWGPCEPQERRENGVFRAPHPCTHFLGQYPPPQGWTTLSLCQHTWQCFSSIPLRSLNPLSRVFPVYTHWHVWTWSKTITTCLYYENDIDFGCWIF